MNKVWEGPYLSYRKSDDEESKTDVQSDQRAGDGESPAQVDPD